MVGLYVDPPAHAIVLSVDEKAQIQALDRTQPGLPMKKGRAGTMTHDYKRHGTTTLFAALDVLEGKVIGRCMQRHRHQEFIRFLNTVEAQLTEKIVHVILDNYAAHKHPKVRQWLNRHPRFTFHFTPTSCSWLNAVEGFFAKLAKRRLKRGVFRSVVDLQATMNRSSQRPTLTPNPSPGPQIQTKSSPPSDEGTKCSIPSTSKAYDTVEKARQWFAQAQKLSGTPRHSAICGGMGALRRTIEETVVKRLFKGIVPRWSDRVIVTKLRTVAWDNALADDFVDMYEELSAYIEGHSHTDEASGAPPEIKDLEQKIAIVDALVKRARAERS